METKFKKGDKVRLIIDSETAARKGATATVTKNQDSHYVYVEWDRDVLSGNQCDGGYYPGLFELITTSPIRTVTKREIVKGVYDKVVVDNTRDGFVWLRLLTSNGEFKFNKNELKTMIKTLSEIVEVMEENDA